MGSGKALPAGVLLLPSDWRISAETGHLEKTELPGLCPGPRDLALWFPGGSDKKGSMLMHTASRKLARALGSLLSVALSSLVVKQLHVIISGAIFNP